MPKVKKKVEKQLSLWDCMEEKKRKKLQKLASYARKFHDDFDRYSECLGMVPAATVLNDMYNSLFKGLPEIESPTIFADCISIISHLLCRKKVYFELVPKMPLYTWTWEMIIGLSGINKSLPIKILLTWLKDEIHRYPDDITSAALKSALLKDSKGIMLIDEAGEMLKEMKGGNAKDSRNLMLSMTDAPQITIGRKGKSRTLDDYEERVIENPALTIVANTTLADFVDKVDVVDFFSGFMQRWNFTIVNRITREDRSEETYFDNDVGSKLIKELKKWHEQIPEGRRYYLGSKAKDVYSDWYKENLSYAAVIGAIESGKEDLISFKQRQKINLIRSAIIYESIINPDNDKISKQAMGYAIRLAEWRLNNLYKLLQNYLFFGEIDGLMKKIFEYLRSRESATKSEILKNVRGFRRIYQAEEVLNTLVEDGELRLEKKRYYLK